MANIVDVIVADRNLATMGRSVKAAGLDTVWAQQGPLTIFAPNDLAFGKLPAGKMQRLMLADNREMLTALLNHHVVEGLTPYADLKDGQKLITTNGRQLSVKVLDGVVTINDARVQGRDSEASNGVVHSLDTVIEMRL